MKSIPFLKFNFFNTGFIFSMISMFVITVSPLAMAEQSKKINKDVISEVLKEMGVLDNKNITMGEVWKKMRPKFPVQIQSQLDMAFSIYKDEKIPQFDISEVKNSKGEAVLAINIKDGNDTARLEFPGKTDVFMKFNGINLGEADIENQKLLAYKIKDEKIIKKDTVKYYHELAKKPLYPTYELWVKMTPYERVSYMIELRRMMKDVETILNADINTESKSSSLDFPFLRLLMGETVSAAAEKSCIIGGHVGSIKKNSLVCSLGTKPGEDYTRGCNKSDQIRSDQISCNPMLYGYNRSSGGPICFKYDVNDTNTRFATSKVCETQSPIDSPQKTYELVQSILKEKNKVSDQRMKELFSEYEEVDKNGNKTKKYKVSRDTWESVLHAKDTGIFYQFETAKVAAESACRGVDSNRKIANKKQGTTYNPDYEFKSTRQQTLACESLRKRVLNLQLFIDSVSIADEIPALPGVNSCPACLPNEAPVVQRPGDAVITPVPADVVPDRDKSKNEAADGTKTITGCFSNATKEAETAGKAAEEKDPTVGTINDQPVADTKDTKAGGGFWSNLWNSPWTKVGLFAAVLGGGLFLTIWGLSRLFKKKKPQNINPYVYPSTTITNPAPPVAPKPIEGGSGSSPITGGGVGGAPR